MAKNTNTNLLVQKGNSFVSSQKVTEYRNRWDSNPKDFIVAGFPLHLDIESAIHCNLRCTFCASTLRQYPTGCMDIGLCKSIIDEGAAKGLCSIKFNLRGEPLLNKDLPQMVEYAKQKGIIDVFINTNGLLMKKEIAKRLINAGLDRVIFSVEGWTSNVYEKYRVGSSFQKIFDNIKSFISLRKENKPKIRIQSAQVPEIIGGEDEYVRFWSPYADDVTVEKLRDEEKDFTHLEKKWSCPYPWLRISIGYDGEIFLCHQSPYVGIGVGNCKNTTIENVWLSPAMKKLRRLHEKGWSHFSKMCSACSYRGTELTKI